MASVGRRPEEETEESSYDRDQHHYHHPKQQQQQQQQTRGWHSNQQQYHNQTHNPHHYNQPYPPHTHPLDQMQNRGQHPQQPPVPHQNGISGDNNNNNSSNSSSNNNNNNNNTDGNYKNNNRNNTLPVPPRMRMRKWSDMTRTIWHYERIEQIGEGTYGQVYRARCKDTNEIVAMKKIRVHHGAHWGMPPTVIREIKILKRLVHPNLVKMIEVVSSKGVEHLDGDDYHKGSDRSRKNKNKNKQKSSVAVAGGANAGNKGNHNESNNGNNNNSSKTDTNGNNGNNNKNSATSSNKQIDIGDARERYKGNLFLVLEYVPHDLTGLLDVAYKFNEVEIKCIFRQLLEALRYMHENKYVHRDIKSSNILIDRNFRLKLADFGLARSIEPPLLDNLHDRGNPQEFTNKVITLWYRPPELLLGETRYGFAVDIWSAGCILAELVLGRPLFTGKTEMDQLHLIFDMVGTPTSKSWPGVRELKLLRTGEASIDGDKHKKRAKLRERYQFKMNSIAPGAVNLIEKLLENDPSKRLTASRALDHRYFSSEPRAPDQPEALGEMKLAEGGSFHEFQTKKKRKEAKAEAEIVKLAALDGGHTMKQAQEECDAKYKSIMEEVARKGLDTQVIKTGAAATAAGGSSGNVAPSEKKKRSGNKEASNESEAMDDDHERHGSSTKRRSTRSSRSLEHGGGNKSGREKDHHRDPSSSRGGRDRRSKERSGEEKTDRERKKRNDPAGTAETHEAGSGQREHRGRERSRSSRRASETEERRKKRRERSSSSSRRDKDKDKDRHNNHREHRRKPSMEEIVDAAAAVGKNETDTATITTTAIKNDDDPFSPVSNAPKNGIGEPTKTETAATEGGVAPGGQSSEKKPTMQDSERSNTKEPVVDGANGKDGDKTMENIVEAPKSRDAKDTSKEEGATAGPPTGSEQLGGNKREPKESDVEKKAAGVEHRSSSSRGDKKRSDRSGRDRDRADDSSPRKDRRDRNRDRDHHHRKRSSKDGGGGERDRDRSRRSNKKRKSSRTRSRSAERQTGSPGRSRHHRDHHRRERDRDRSRREPHRDREHPRRPHRHEDHPVDGRSRNDRPNPHNPFPMRRGPEFGGNPRGLGGPPRGDMDAYGPGSGPPRGGPDFHGPHGGGPPRGLPGGRPPPMDYYPPHGGEPPFDGRSDNRGPWRDRDRDRR